MEEKRENMEGREEIKVVGMSFLEVVGVVLIILKGFNLVDISWVVAFLPYIVIIGLKLIVMVLGFVLGMILIDREVKK